MTPFDRFRQHVRNQPEAVAVVTAYRVATYRKMWSRIERSTARLQAEWGIRSGDTIAYLGCGHLDALVMYFAAARCGARLLPLEHAVLQDAAASIVAAVGATLVLHDDALTPGGLPALPCRPLSTLIATPCRFQESAAADSAAVSLLQWPQSLPDLDGPSGPAGALATLRERSLDALADEGDGSDVAAGDAMRVSAAPAGCAAPADNTEDVMAYAVAGPLFDAAVFGPQVLATLLAGGVLQLGRL